MLQIGSLVDNKYKILSEVGHGGMSVVYLAINERANKTWAIKEIRKDGVVDFEAVKQGLVVETDMLKKLNHDHLPSIIDVIDMDDSFLIVMDYIEGKSLHAVLKNSGAQPQDMVIQWGIQLCDVLGYLHSREPAIIYRDMKPANVMLKPNGDVTLIDFGTAREFKNRTMVEDTTCLGTRGYAAPEQFGGRGQTDGRTDIYCLGATLYHLITGHSPAEPPYEIKPLSYWNPAFSGSGLEYIIAKCCQQDPEHRYQSCAELMYDLEHVEEMDYQSTRARRSKWLAFLSSILVFLISVAGMLGVSALKNNATTETYSYYLDQAELLTSDADFPQFVQYIKEAVEIDPTQYEAYDMLVSRIEDDYMIDVQTELSPLQAVLNDSGGGTRDRNEILLQQANTAGYADIQFRFGKLLFLMSDGQDAYLKQAAIYFERALEEGGMAASQDEITMRKAAIAKALATIGNYIGDLGKSGGMFVEQENSYTTLWEDLKNLYAINTVEALGSRDYCIALHKRIANMIVLNYNNFSNWGVAKEEMLTLLTDIENSLREIESTLAPHEASGDYKKWIDDAYGNITTARNSISALKGGVG